VIGGRFARPRMPSVPKYLPMPTSRVSAATPSYPDLPQSALKNDESSKHAAM
jgi:hypothetical protein